MTVFEMIRLCNMVTGSRKSQIRIVAHEVLKEFESIDFYDLTEPNPRPLHRIRKFGGQWNGVF